MDEEAFTDAEAVAAIYFYNRLRRPGVDIASFGDPYLGVLQAYYQTKRNRSLWALDITSDLGIPCFVALSRRRDRHPEHIVMGFGCHLDPKIALTRAVTEVNQILFGVLREMPDGKTAYYAQDPALLEWLQTVTLARHAYLAPDPAQPETTARDVADTESDDVLDDVLRCVQKASAHELDVCVLNLTREEIGLPAVKVIVPGLVHWWRRLGQPRLYDVPVSMGWRAHPLREAQMNPRSIVL